VTVLRAINLNTLQLAWNYLKVGNFEELARGVCYFLGRTSPVTKFRPIILHGSIASDTPILFPIHTIPLVSIIIPVHNQWNFTHSCLASIVRHSGNIPYEVIIADDVSSDRTACIDTLDFNIKVVTNKSNLGFLRNCNNAATIAQGKYLLFLNNDTNVQPGWLTPLVTVMEADPTVGITGAKLVYPDGMLQEAGGIIWNDASGWNFGWQDDPEKPEYNYVKDVDYVSGAALMVRRELWEKASGFDAQFAPAYYEDTDLAFRARALGWRVVYQPRSVVVHFEGVSHGKDITRGIKNYQERNRALFLERWSDVLRRDHFPNAHTVFRARDRSRFKKSILVIDHYVPMHDRDAGSFFMFSLLRALVTLGYRITFWPENLYRHEPYCTELQQLGVEVMYGQRSFDKFLIENGANFDAAFLTRNHIAIHFIDAVRRHIRKVIYHDPDLEFLREERRIALEGGTLESLATIKERELYLFRNCDVIGIHSPVEREIIRTELPGAHVEVIPLPVHDIVATTTPYAQREGLLFIGGTHPPNSDALSWFIRDVFPLVRRTLPAVILTVAGEVTRDKIKGLDLTNIVFSGYIPDLLPCYEKARIFIAPLRYGAGIKGKILEAMSYGLPIVTTAVGAEGIGLGDGEDALIATDRDAFAQAVTDLYGDEQLWEKLRRNAYAIVNANFSQEIFRRRVGKVMEELLT